MGLIVNSWVQNAWALWASRLALFAIQLFVIAFVLHRLQILGTPLTMGLFGTAAVTAILGGAAACIAVIQIWNNGGRGGLRSTFAVFVALLVFVWPAANLPTATRLPAINDISTDLDNPPRLSEVANDPLPTGFMASERLGPQPTLQEAGYPDLRPLIVSRSVAAAFDAARTIAKREGLDIVIETPPKGDHRIGRIQAVDETLLMGFRDDVVIRVQPEGEKARIDVRSASRYGQHDFGRNAARIRNLSRQLRARLDFVLPVNLEDEPDEKVAQRNTRKTKTSKRHKIRPRPQRVRKKKRRRSRSKAQRGQARKAWQRE